VRVTLSGDALAGFTWPGAASHLKVLFRPHESNSFLTQQSTNDFSSVDLSTFVARTYTPRRFDPERHELDIDFLIHGHGLASGWAHTVSPGETVYVSLPRAKYSPDPAADWLVLAGDESALPAIGTILDAGVGVATSVLIEGSEADHAPLSNDPLVQVKWVAGSEDASPGHALIGAFERWERPVGHGQVWVACEAMAVRRIRRHLLEAHALAPTAIVTRGYWRLGEANHPDHDFGEDGPAI
jgi:NADPH-dependent ferric siderophore reductase